MMGAMVKEWEEHPGAETPADPRTGLEDAAAAVVVAAGREGGGKVVVE